MPGYVKYSTPAVANGEVFVGTAASLAVFGELGPGSTATPSASASPSPSASSTSTTPPSGGVQIDSGGAAAGVYAVGEPHTGGGPGGVAHVMLDNDRLQDS